MIPWMEGGVSSFLHLGLQIVEKDGNFVENDGKFGLLEAVAVSRVHLLSLGVRVVLQIRVILCVIFYIHIGKGLGWYLYIFSDTKLSASGPCQQDHEGGGGEGRRRSGKEVLEFGDVSCVCLVQ